MANSQFAIAVHILAMLANNCDERMKSGYLAKSVNTNAVVIRRILCDLHDADLVVSQSGYSGGSCLTRSPEEIRLSDVYQAISHDDIFALHPKQPDPDCSIGSEITGVLGGIKDEVQKSVDEKFSSYTLKDVIEEINTQRNAKDGK